MFSIQDFGWGPWETDRFSAAWISTCLPGKLNVADWGVQSLFFFRYFYFYEHCHYLFKALKGCNIYIDMILSLQKNYCTSQTSWLNNNTVSHSEAQSWLHCTSFPIPTVKFRLHRFGIFCILKNIPRRWLVWIIDMKWPFFSHIEWYCLQTCCVFGTLTSNSTCEIFTLGVKNHSDLQLSTSDS